MTEKLLYHHDKYFKGMFSRKEVAVNFIQNYFPPEVVQHLDLSQFEIRKDSFVDPHLTEHFSDILYQVGLRHTETDQPQSAYIYLLFDHKSYSDSLVAFQLLRYATNIWDMALKQRRADKAQKGKRIRLPVIFPLVVYHGEEGWTASQQFIDLFDAPEELKPYIPNFAYWLCDLTTYDDKEIIGQALLQICLRVLKYSRAEDILARLPEIFRLFEEISNQRTATEVLYSVLRYLSHSSEQLTKERLTQVVEAVFEQGGETMATIAQQLRMEGEAIGLKKSQEKIREAEQKAWQNEQKARQNEQKARQNEQKARQREEEAWQLAFNNVRRTLAVRFGIERDQFDKRLEKFKLPVLKTLNDVVFEVKTLVEFEAALTKLETPPPDEEKLSPDKTDSTSEI